MEKLVLGIVAVLGLLVILRRFISYRKGEPSGDELSKLILQKSSSVSFYISLYYWLLISYLSDRIDLKTEALIGYGVVGMAIIFVGTWSFFKLKGLTND